MRNFMMVVSRAGDPPEVEKVRELARLGQLAAVYRTAAPILQLSLRRGVLEIAYQVVFQRITFRVEQRRRHSDCVAGVRHMRPECLDRFHEAVEAVAVDTLRKAEVPILRLDAWMASTAVNATINDYRIRRGKVGAQQKPRVPQWLCRALGDDPWLVDLALAILTWVGIPDTAGPAVWPVGSWTERRAAVTGKGETAGPAVVWREIEQVLTAMRHREDWYAHYVEGPIGHKPVPVAPAVRMPDGELLEPPPLELVSADERQDSVVLDLAERCLDAIRIGLAQPGRDPASVVRHAIHRAFCAERLDLTGDAGQDVDELLSDQAAAEWIIDAVLEIVGGRADPAGPHRRQAG
jgi:hypothetical protein